MPTGLQVFPPAVMISVQTGLKTAKAFAENLAAKKLSECSEVHGIFNSTFSQCYWKPFIYLSEYKRKPIAVTKIAGN